MKVSWPLLVPAGLFLASPCPPSLLNYNLVAFGQNGPACDLTIARSCEGLPATTPGALATAQSPPAPPVIEVPPDKGVRLVVSIPQQKLYVFRDGELLATSEVSTGKRGHGTPVGIFRILQKAITHHSNLYSNAPMPYMQRLTEGGVALHAGHVPGYPASHGCIRLPWPMAKKLYRLTNFSTTTVTVTRLRPQSPEDAFKLVQPIELAATTS